MNMTNLEVGRPRVSMESVKGLLTEGGLGEAVTAGVNREAKAGFQVSWLKVPGSYDRIIVEHRPNGSWAGLHLSSSRKQGMLAAEKEEAKMVARYQEVLQEAGLEVVQMTKRTFAPLVWLVVKP